MNEYQFVELSAFLQPSSSAPASPTNLLREIVFATDDLKALQSFLVAHKIPLATPTLPLLETSRASEEATAKKEAPANHERAEVTFLSVLDPEGHRIGFVQLPAEELTKQRDQRTMRLIHAGFVVHNREAEDRFYKDILGFHVYWHGGMKEDEDNWVDMQVPNGTDWIEYMLGVSPNASHKTLGVMNHFAIGVNDIETAAFAASKNGISVGEEPKIGRDGKWQLNLYDPDETRVELMEFTPTKDPCCSPYTGPHPKP